MKKFLEIYWSATKNMFRIPWYYFLVGMIIFGKNPSWLMCSINILIISILFPSIATVMNILSKRTENKLKKIAMQKKLYFGHPINTYGTEIEKKLLEKISEIFPDWNIENPNQKHHQQGYTRWQKTIGNGMDYFFKEVLPDCQGGIFLAFRDGKWGAGIFGEAKFLAEKKLPVWQIDIDGNTKQTDISLAETLTIEETRARLRDKNNKMLPY